MRDREGEKEKKKGMGEKSADHPIRKAVVILSDFEDNQV